MTIHMESSPKITDLQAVEPINPPAAYIGGKRLLSRKLVDRISRLPHNVYVEPFVGMGGVFFRRSCRPRAEVINDISADVTTLFRILQRHYEAFMDMLKWQMTSRAEFNRLTSVAPETLTDLERAARFLYLQRLTFGGKVNGRSFGVDRRTPARFDVGKLAPMLEEVHDRLASVKIERLPYADLIRRYDAPDALFYLDPPYFGCEGDYGAHAFAKADFARLAGLLAGISGQFILSINDIPETRAIFAQFMIEPVELSYRISGKPTPARKLIISNATT